MRHRSCLVVIFWSAAVLERSNFHHARRSPPVINWLQTPYLYHVNASTINPTSPSEVRSQLTITQLSIILHPSFGWWNQPFSVAKLRETPVSTRFEVRNRADPRRLPQVGLAGLASNRRGYPVGKGRLFFFWPTHFYLLIYLLIVLNNTMFCRICCSQDDMTNRPSQKGRLVGPWPISHS